MIDPGQPVRTAVVAIAMLFCMEQSVCAAEPQSPAKVDNQPPAKVDKKSSDYRDGFSDGCEHATSGATRDERRFLTNVAYHGGWIAGFQNCYSHMTINTNGDPNGPFKNPF